MRLVVIAGRESHVMTGPFYRSAKSLELVGPARQHSITHLYVKRLLGGTVKHVPAAAFEKVDASHNNYLD